MPIYEYKCSTCAEVSEEFRNIADRNAPACCRVCGAAAHRILSSFGVLHKSPPGYHAESPSHSSDSARMQIRNCTIENVKVGISVPKGASIEMKGNRFKNVETPVEFRDK